ncbi:hypothetical protein ACFLYQ_03240 [Chloroflexota bacterium]
MLTIFSTLKPFQGNIKITQTNAIRSWTALAPACEVILFGNEEGTAEIAGELGVKQVTDVERNEYGTPLVSSMFKITQDMAENNLLCYVNADIVLMSDFIEAAGRVTLPHFLMVGRRRDIDIDELIDFRKEGWDKELKAKIGREGKLHGIAGIDYFVFPKGLYNDIPPLAVGRPGWDNWLIYHTRSRKIPVIDATEAVMVAHQNHGHADFTGGDKGFWTGPEAKKNVELAGGADHAFHIGFADWKLDKESLRPARGWRSFYMKCRAFPVLHPRLRFLLPLVKLPGKITGVFLEMKRGE